MSDFKQTYVPFRQEGSEDFSRTVSYSHRIYQQFMPLIFQSFDQAVPSCGTSFTIADYGSADGGSSYSTIRKCISILREKFGSSLPIQVLYEDEPVNDFRSSFQRADGAFPGILGLSEEFGKVFVLASGTSFYEQCVPEKSLDFVICSCSSQWLSRCPVKMETEIFFPLATLSERVLGEHQAKEDWETFLLHRAKELKPDGCMVVIGPVRCDKELLYAITHVWESFVTDGTITQIEFFNTNFPAVPRSVEEYRDPLTNVDSPVYKAGLRITSQYSANVKWVGEEADDAGTGGKITFAQKMTQTTRAWTERGLYDGLNEDRAEEEKMQILERFYGRFSEFLSRNGKPQMMNNHILFGIAIQKITTT